MPAARIGLFDADIFAYRWASSAEKRFDWGEDSGGETWTTTKTLGETCEELRADVFNIADNLDLNRIIICLSDPSRRYFRHDILASYKHSRAGHKPNYLAECKAFLTEAFETYQRPTLEADDCMGILSTWGGMTGRKVIISSDKDMKTIPGWLFNPDKDTTPRKVSPEEAAYWHMYQTLVGDATDGYQGCPGIGPKKAAALLAGKNLVEAWPLILQAYKNSGLTADAATQQARVARICRASDYDFNHHKVIPWNPPSSPASPPVTACASAATAS